MTHAALDHSHSHQTGAGPLLIQRCRWCRMTAYRRLLCPTCGSTDLDEEHSAGLGVIQRVRVVGRHTGMPRTIAVVALEEGVRVHSTVIGVAPDIVRIGDRVSLTATVAMEQPRLTSRLAQPACDR